MGTVIGRPKANDFGQVFPLLKQLWPRKRLDRNRTKAVFTNGLKDKNRKFLVVRFDGKVIGFASLSLKESLYDGCVLGHIDELIVDEKFRRKGIGKRLLRRIMAVAKENSCRRVELDSAFRRKDAHKFYERTGFEKCNFLFSKKL